MKIERFVVSTQSEKILLNSMLLWMKSSTVDVTITSGKYDERTSDRLDLEVINREL